ncbi:MAG: chorismate-binding protein, partial [Actinomycetota bacterium]|nr:chorismate-binding protein [Actinomycetota bacterium]
MSMSSDPTSIWATREQILIGQGNVDRLDPGTGPGRYARALDALRSSGRSLALASFTFDIDEPGSIVEIPERVETVSAADLTLHNGQWSGSVVSTGYDDWTSGLAGALETIAADVVEKVVLTRQVEMTFSDDLDIRSIVARLISAEPDSFTFAVDGLVGASPELLVSLRNGHITSLALAGTAVEAAELSSDKMDREHSLSQSSVEMGLAPHVMALDVDDRTVLQFGDLKHLATRFDGRARPETTVLDVLASLHPTAAVAGTPKDTAMKTIKDLEPRSRGRYAGPVGWFDSAGDGEFAIALRCGLLRGREATLYAGGGIVAGSDADA